MDCLEFEELLLIQWRFQVSVALIGSGAKSAEPACRPPLRDVVASEPLLPLPYLEPLVRGLSPRPACHNARLHALPADRLQRREESFGVSVVAPAAVTLLFE